MKPLAMALTMAVALPSVGWPQAARVTDFSGTWKYEASGASGLRVGGLEGGGYVNWGPAAPTLVITQSATEITLDRGPGETKWVYRLDGMERLVPDPTNTEPGGPYPFKTKARWDGPKLVLYTRQGLNQQRDILTLAGSVLRITRDTETPPGSGIDLRLVYNKISP